MPPTPEKLGALLADYCRNAGISRLEVFGSVARGDARRGSDVDLIATFASNPGIKFFAMEDEMKSILGVPVHLLTHNSVERMSNPYKKEAILADSKLIYNA